MNRVHDRDYIFLRGMERDPWFQIEGDGNVVARPGLRPTPLVVRKIKRGSSRGPALRDGDYVRIRGTDGDPHFQIESDGNVVARGDATRASTLVIHHRPRRPGAMLRYRDPVVIRGTDRDPHFVIERDGNVSAAGGSDDATLLAIESI